MAIVSQAQSSGAARPAGQHTEPVGASDQFTSSRRVKSHWRWHPGVRLVLALVVLVPAVSVAFVTASDASSEWSSRQEAQVAARDTSELQQVARARAEVNAALIPTMALTLGDALNVHESAMSKLLGVNFTQLFNESLPAVEHDPTFQSTPTLKAESAAFLASIPAVRNGTVQFGSENDVVDKFTFGTADQWLAVFNQLQADIGPWHPPGSFEGHLAALRQAFVTFLAGEYEFEGSMYVLEGDANSVVVDNQGGWTPMTAKQEAIWFAGQFSVAVSGFTGRLGPLGEKAWNAMQADPKVQAVEATMQEGVTLALSGGKSTFSDQFSQEGVAQLDALTYFQRLDMLVQAASQDVHNEATTQASSATDQLIREILLLLALVVLAFGGVFLAATILTRPLRKLSDVTGRLHEGEFDLEALPRAGPREVVSTIAMFNDMASTLRAIEAKTVALSTENLARPELQVPLPGRTGEALQAAVDKLTARTRERELQRQQMWEASTHDRLTGVLSRSAVLDFLSNDVSRRRESGETVAVLFIDLDGLKPLNDNYGHEAGDAAIRATGEALRQATKQCDVVGRLGGDEFLVVLCAAHSVHAAEVATEIRTAVATHNVASKDGNVALQCSVGVALAACDITTDPKELVRQADEAMYEAKVASRAARTQMAATAAMQSHAPTSG